MEEKKKIDNDICKDCFMWKSRLDIPFNKIHKNSKKCLAGNIVQEKTRSCFRFRRKPIMLKRKK